MNDLLTSCTVGNNKYAVKIPKVTLKKQYLYLSTLTTMKTNYIKDDALA